MLSSLFVCLCSFMVLMIIMSSPGVNHVFGDSVTSVIPVGSFPQALVFNPSNNNIYVTNRDSGTVSVIETDNNTVIKNVTVGSFPEQMLFNPTNNDIDVANVISNSISVIDSNVNEVTNEIEVGIDPIDLEFNPSNNYVY